MEGFEFRPLTEYEMEVVYKIINRETIDDPDTYVSAFFPLHGNQLQIAVHEDNPNNPLFTTVILKTYNAGRQLLFIGNAKRNTYNRTQRTHRPLSKDLVLEKTKRITADKHDPDVARDIALSRAVRAVPVFSAVDTAVSKQNERPTLAAMQYEETIYGL